MLDLSEGDDFDSGEPLLRGDERVGHVQPQPQPRSCCGGSWKVVSPWFIALVVLVIIAVIVMLLVALLSPVEPLLWGVELSRWAYLCGSAFTVLVGLHVGFNLLVLALVRFFASRSLTIHTAVLFFTMYQPPVSAALWAVFTTLLYKHLLGANAVQVEIYLSRGLISLLVSSGIFLGQAIVAHGIALRMYGPTTPLLLRSSQKEVRINQLIDAAPGEQGTPMRQVLRRWSLLQFFPMSIKESALRLHEGVGSKEAIAALSNGDDHVQKFLADFMLERKRVVGQLKSHAGILRVTRSLLVALALLICAIVTLAVFQVPSSTYLIPIGSALLALSFAYGGTLQEMFQSLYLVYISKPFAVGEMIQLDEGTMLDVVDIGLLTTVFRDFPGNSLVYIRNAACYGARITNLSRCRGPRMIIMFTVDPWSTWESLQVIKERLLQFSLQHPKQLRGQIGLDANEFDSSGMLIVRCLVSFRKSVTWGDVAVWRPIKSKVLLLLQETAIARGIQVKAPGGWLDYRYDTSALEEPKNLRK